MLKSTYGTASRLVDAQIQVILDMNKCEPTAKDVGKYRPLYDGHVRCLKSHGADVEAAGFVIAVVIIRKLPTKIGDNINRENKSDFWDLQKLRHAIEVEIGHLQSVEVTTSLDEDDDDSILVTNEINKPSTATLSVATESNSFAMCRLCGDKNHSAVSCLKYATIMMTDVNVL